MNRLQKKCFIASAGLHLLLLVILLVGPAFLSSRNPSDELPVLDFIPAKLVDAPFSGGGNPNAKPPPPAPPEVKPPEVVKPAPAPVEQIQKPPPQAKEAVKPAPKKIEISTQLVKRKTDSEKENAKAPAQAREANAKATEQLRSAVRSLRANLSPSTTVDIPGPGGEAYANYAQVVKSVYTQAWIVPEGVEDEEATTKVTVTIARDGTVISARILRASGSVPVDRSVQSTLERVKFIAPFPEGAREKERTFTINFNLKAKRLLG